MSGSVPITIDGVRVSARNDQTVIEAADAAGIYIPRLCNHPELTPFGGCRLCTVLVNGRPQSACTTPVSSKMVVENDTPRLRAHRRDLIDMLFVEGNHFCMSCERSGSCELQGLAYRFGIAAPRYPHQYPDRSVDASHPDVLIDQNRCILCARCVRASRDIDGKAVFGFVGRGIDKRIAVNSGDGLVGTDITVVDKAVEICPVGAILRKRVGFTVPIGERLFDDAPIGSALEARNPSSK